MKKYISIILVFCLVTTAAFSMTGCKNDEENLSAKVKEKLLAYQTDLEDSAASFKSNEAIRDYLTNWAKSRDIDCTADSSGNVIMNIKSTKAYKEAPPAVVLCSYDSSRFADCIYPMSMALYIAKNNENTGKLSVIFTSETGHDFAGIKNLDSKYFTDDTKVFTLNGGSKNIWSQNSGGRSSYTFTNTIDYTQPSGTKAFKISISGLPGGVPDSKISSYPNPIKEIGSLLAYFKTNALIYELAKVNGGTNGNAYPKSASTVIVINEDDYGKFESRMEKAIETFMKKNQEDYPDVTYTYEEVDLPDQVMTKKCLNEFVIVLYTLIDGVYARDKEDNLLSITNVGSIKCRDGICTVSASANSLSASGLSEVDNTYKTTCSLSEIRYEKIDQQTVWFGHENDQFYQDIAAAFNEFSGKEMEYKPCITATNTSYVFAKNNNCDIVNVSVNEDRIERYTGTIITYLMNLTHTE